jgi:hypothetical protein
MWTDRGIKRGAYTRSALGLGVAAAVLLASGCGGGQASTSVSVPQSATTDQATTSAASTAATPRPAAGDHLAPVATITRSAKGTAFAESISLGPIRYGEEGAPPAEVLDACGENDTATVATSAFVEGAVTVRYTRGILPATGYFQLGRGENTLDNIVGNLEPGENEPTESLLVINHDGAWDCHGDEEGRVQLTFQPGQSATYELWILMIGARTNEHPTLTQGSLDVLGLDYLLHSEALGAAPTTTVTGPRAATCRNPEEEHSTSYGILPFARLPHTAHFATLGGLTCTAGGGTE